MASAAQQHQTGGGTTGKASLVKAKLAIADRISPEAFLSKLGARERVYVERHLVLCQTEGHDKLWQRLACTLATLAPMPPKAGAQQTLQFYVADGKYRMQVFALHDPKNGTVSVYCENILDTAQAAGLLSAPSDAGSGVTRWKVPGGVNDTIAIEVLDGKSANLQPFCKDMTGWNRKALKVSIPVGASEAQIEAVESLCALASQSWVVAPKQA